MIEDQKRYSAVDAVAYIERMQKLHAHRDWRLTVAICNPGGLTAHQTVEVEAIQHGFDWTAGQLIVQPALPLSMLTPEQLADITKSVRAGGSWHAYEREKKSRAELRAAQARIAELEAEQAGLLTYRTSVLEEAAELCDGMRDLKEAKEANDRASAALERGDDWDSLACLRHHSTVSLFNGALERAAKAIRALAGGTKEE